MMAILRPIGQVETPKREPDISPPRCYCSEGAQQMVETHTEDAHSTFPLAEDDE